MKDLKQQLGTLVGIVAGHFINGLFLMIAWNAIAVACSLPKFSYIVCVAIAWTVRWVLTALSPKINKSEK